MTTLMEEEPYAAAVDTEYLSSTCSKCFALNLDQFERVKISRCAGCHVLSYCGAKCQKADWKDHKAECKLFRSASFVPSMDARLVMRILEKSRSQPDFKAYNGRTYDCLMHPSSMHRENANFCNNAKVVYDEICRFIGSNAPDFQTVFLALSKKAINAFPIYDGLWTYTSRGTGLYLGLSVLDHSCRPDAFLVNQGSKMKLRTTNKDLVYSDKLTISYHSDFFFMDTSTRRSKLVTSYFFHCKCEECEDLESNKKKISGRPACCPNSWFDTADRICNNCKLQVSSDLADKATVAIYRFHNAVTAYSKGEYEESALLAFIPEWIELYDSCKEVVSDENAYLFAILNMIYSTAPLLDFNDACKFADLCAPYLRKNPYCVFSAILFSRRHVYYEMAQKPLQERKEALNEALAIVQVVFGPEHEFTQMLLEKKTLYELCDLKTR